MPDINAIINKEEYIHFNIECLVWNNFRCVNVKYIAIGEHIENKIQI